MAHAPTFFYFVMVERYRGTTPRDVDDVLECDTFYFSSAEDARAKAQTVVASAPAPALLPDCVEVTTAGVERFYYVGEEDEPLAPMSLDEYQALVDAGDAVVWWDGEWGHELFEQDLPPEVARVLAERERVAYEEWAAADRSAAR